MLQKLINKFRYKNNNYLDVGETWDKKWGKFDISKFKYQSFLTDRWVLYHKSLIEKYLKKMNKNSVFLEAGCGLGHWCFYVSENYKIKSIGVDVAQRTIRRLNDYCNNNKNNLVSFLVDDLNNSKLKNDYCDMFISLGVIEHFKDSTPMMKTLYRLVRPGGMGIITVPNVYCMQTFTRPVLQSLGKWSVGYEKSFSAKSLRKIALSVGFEIIENGILPSGELFGSFLTYFPFIGNMFKKISYFIERRQNIFGFLLFVVVKKSVK